MVAKILDGKQIAKEYRQRLKNQVNDLKEYGFTPKLSVILVGNDGASQSYVKSKKKAAEKIGMISEIIHLDESTSEEVVSVSYTHLTLPTICLTCRSRWSAYH